MTRNTIDFGIDLGTTNSVIACMDRGELVVVKNAVTGSEITPSAVKVNAKGTIIVGQNAYDEAEFDANNVATEFKRWIGNGEHSEFHFEKSGKRMTAAGLSSEVLKVLRASASSRFQDEDLRASVITIPAMFPIPACEETVAAAKLAGIETCPLLQEPIAAAIAYGYQAGAALLTPAFWLRKMEDWWLSATMGTTNSAAKTTTGRWLRSSYRNFERNTETFRSVETARCREQQHD